MTQRGLLIPRHEQLLNPAPENLRQPERQRQTRVEAAAFDGDHRLTRDPQPFRERGLGPVPLLTLLRNVVLHWTARRLSTWYRTATSAAARISIHSSTVDPVTSSRDTDRASRAIPPMVMMSWKAP